MNQLSFRYDYDASFTDPKLDRDDFGLLTMAVVSKHFSGKCDFWVQWQDVREFGQALGAFPIESKRPIKAEWGFDSMEGEDRILAVVIAPADNRGNLDVRVEIADRCNTKDRVRTSFTTNFPDLLDFQRQIERLMDREIQEAVLSGR